MKGAFVAQTQITIDAPAAAVWRALTEPGLVKQYMHGTEMRADWTVGGAVTWSGEWKGQSYVDKGEVLAFEPEKLIKYTHWSPLGGSPDEPDNYHTVTFDLSEHDGATVLVLHQDNNASQEEADQMAENGWAPILQGLKAVVEKLEQA